MILQSNKKIAEAILSTSAILDNFINLLRMNGKSLVVTRGIGCLVNLLDKHEIIDYFKKNKYLLANRFRESLEGGTRSC